MRAITALAAILVLGAALPAAAQVYPVYPTNLGGSTMPQRVCTVTTQPPIAPKIVTISRSGMVTERIGGAAGETTTTSVCTGP